VNVTDGAITRHFEPAEWMARRACDRLVSGLAWRGVSVRGSWVLEVRDRTSGRLRRSLVKLLRTQHRDYLVASDGVAEWVRNVRADGGRLTLVVGRRRKHLIAVDLIDSEKSPVLRAYLQRWSGEPGGYFHGVTAESPEEDLSAIAHLHPIFELSPESLRHP
jgi:hypothetical protein